MVPTNFDSLRPRRGDSVVEAGRRPRPSLVGAVDAASHERTTTGIPLIAVVGVVRPVSLNFPGGSTRESKQSASKSPSALVSVFVSLSVIPGIQFGIRLHLGKLMARHTCQRSQALRVCLIAINGGTYSCRSTGIATRIAIEVEEKPELDGDCVARTCTVPRAVTCRTAFRGYVDRIIGARLRCSVGYFANFRQDRRSRVAAAWSAGRVHDWKGGVQRDKGTHMP